MNAALSGETSSPGHYTCISDCTTKEKPGYAGLSRELLHIYISNHFLSDLHLIGGFRLIVLLVQIFTKEINNKTH